MNFFKAPEGEDEFALRRKWAQQAWNWIRSTLVAVIVIAIVCEAEQVDNLVKLAFIITPILLCMTGIIVQYAQLVYSADKNKKDKESESKGSD